MLLSTVTQLIAKAPPTDVYLAGQNATATVASGFTFSDANSLFTMLPRHSFVPDVIICTLPAVEHVQVRASSLLK